LQDAGVDLALEASVDLALEAAADLALEARVDLALEAGADIANDVPADVTADAALRDNTFRRRSLGVDTSTPLGFCRTYYRVRYDFNAWCFGYALGSFLGFSDKYVDETICPRFVAGLAAGRGRFEPTKVEACLTVYDSRACTFDDGHFLVIPACDAVTPLVPVGGACTGPFVLDECTGSAECESNFNACGAKCVDHLPEGAACTVLGNPPYCASGTKCLDGRCGKYPRAGLNQPCGVICADGLFCDFGVCHPQKTTGACVDPNECLLPSNCLGPPGAQRCLRPGQPGEACNPAARECAIPGVCGPGAVCSGARAAIGAPCGLVNGKAGDYLTCVDGATCADVCVATDPNRACTFTQDCQNLSFCDPATTTCKPCPVN
jgi:hypothetical protein